MSILVETLQNGPHYSQSIEPSNPIKETTWFDTENGKHKVYINSVWVDIIDVAIVNNNVPYGYSMGGNDGGSWSSIDRILFPFDSGTSSYVGNVTATVYRNDVCNSSNYGY